MTTHDRDKVIAAAKECYHPYSEWSIDLARFYAIAFEAGRVAEREACAVVCERLISGDGICADNEVWIHDCAEAIRAREDRK